MALYWIKGTNKEWRPFVQHRVNEIRKTTSPEIWRHCPGVTNPTDLPSRGMRMYELEGSGLWRYGPEWLIGSFTLDDADDPTKMPEECYNELKASSKKTHNLAITEVKCTIGDIIRCKRFRKLVRVTAYVMRAVRLFKNKRDNQCNGPLSTEEHSDAECRWIKQALSREFGTREEFRITEVLTQPVLG